MDGPGRRSVHSCVNVLTHFFSGWAVAETSRLEPKDRALATWSAVAPDLDGLAALPDLVNRVLGRPETDFYFRYHHVWTHGLPAALVATALAALLAKKKRRVAALVFLSFHLHLVCDLAGSRGPTPADTWPVFYLSPVSSWPELSWSGQWALNDWRNVLLTAALLALSLILAVGRGYSPVSLLSKRADAAVVAALRERFRSTPGGTGRRRPRESQRPAPGRGRRPEPARPECGREDRFP